jgi:hypothetical protein
MHSEKLHDEKIIQYQWISFSGHYHTYITCILQPTYLYINISRSRALSHRTRVHRGEPTRETPTPSPACPCASTGLYRGRVANE